MRLYLDFISMNIKSQLQYKLSFVMLLIGRGIVSVGSLIGMAFLFDRFNVVKGFSFEEVLLCFAVVSLAFYIAECFFRGFDTFSQIISNGEFDRVMVRPVNEIFLVLISKIEFTNLGRMFFGFFILAVSIPACGVKWDFLKAMILISMIISGIIIFASLFLIYAALCFFTIEGLEFMNIFTDGGKNFGQYPYSIYGKEVLKILTFIIPLACFQYYPLLWLFGRSENIINIFTPLFGILFVIPAYLLWRIGVKKYKSTGS